MILPERPKRLHLGEKLAGRHELGSDPTISVLIGSHIPPHDPPYLASTGPSSIKLTRGSPM